MPKPLTTAALAATLTTAALAVTGLALSGGPQASAAAADDTPGYWVTALTSPWRSAPDDDQPCRVSADLYPPDGAGAATRYPAILTTHGFGGDKADRTRWRGPGRSPGVRRALLLRPRLRWVRLQDHLDDPD